jgi:hypothetical protein
MTAFNMSSRWAVQLEGDAVDLANLDQKLNEGIRAPNDAFCSRLNDIYALRKASWDTANGSEEVENLAREEIELLRACLNVADGSGPITIGTIFELADDGRILGQTRRTRLDIRVKKNPNDFISPLDFRALQSAALSNSQIRQGLADYKAGGTWFDLYRSLEAVQKHHGGEKQLLSALPSEAAEIKRFKRTANTYRHTEGMFERDPNPMTPEEAFALVGRLLRSLLPSGQISHIPLAFPAGVTSINVPNYDFDAGDVVGLKKLELGPA